MECGQCGVELGPFGYPRKIDNVMICEECFQKEEKKKQQEIELINKEAFDKLENVTDEQTKQIVITTSDIIEGKNIIEYIDIISVAKYDYFVKPTNTFFNSEIKGQVISEKARAEESSDAEKLVEKCMKQALDEFKKKAFLLGADAIIGIKIDNDMDYSIGKSWYTKIAKSHLTGTVVKLKF
jgi:uncharacterized protein YbjQ (UPF0145 family)